MAAGLGDLPVPAGGALSTGPVAALRTAALVAVGSTLAGLPVGVLWWLLAPLPQVVKRADGIYRAGEGDESSVAADGWFALTTLVAGVLVALVVYLRTRPGRRRCRCSASWSAACSVRWSRGGSARCSGPTRSMSTAAALTVGARFDGPLDVSAYGVLLAWPMGAVITYFAVVGRRRGRRRVEPSREPPPGRRQSTRRSGAVRPALTRSRSAGASRTCSPRRPAET